jgi:hypothetical protein
MHLTLPTPPTLHPFLSLFNPPTPHTQVRLGQVSYVVMDEANRMLDMKPATLSHAFYPPPSPQTRYDGSSPPDPNPIPQVRFGQVSYVVMDEADRMLDRGSAVSPPRPLNAFSSPLPNAPPSPPPVGPPRSSLLRGDG